MGTWAGFLKGCTVRGAVGLYAKAMLLGDMSPVAVADAVRKRISAEA